MSRIKLQRRLFLVLALVCLAFAIGGTTAALAVTVAKSGKAVTAVRTVTDDNYNLTTSNTYQDVAAMTTTVSVPANQKALLLITFSAETKCGAQNYDPADKYCFVRVLVDGSPANPGEVVFRSSNDTGGYGSAAYNWQTNSMEFIAGPLNPGTHNVKVQFRTNTVAVVDPELQFLFGKKTLTVLRARV